MATTQYLFVREDELPTVVSAAIDAITGDVTFRGNPSVSAIGATKVHFTMLNADVFSTAATWSALETFTAGIAVTGGVTVDTINKLTLTQPASSATLTILNNKSLTVNNIMTLASADNAVLTFQGTDTYIGRATIDTLTNKTYDTAGAGNVLKINGNQVSAVTGSGNTVVLQNTPTFITPILGVATATSINGLAITTVTSGTLTINNSTTVTGPAASGTIMTLGNVETVTGAKTFNDGKLILAGSTSGTTTLHSAGTAGTSSMTFPSGTDTVVTLAATQTLTNKTLTAPVITTIVNTGTLTLPTATDTLVARTTTDTLTNKTLTSPVINVTSDATGDIYYRNSGGAFTRLAIGGSATVLTVSGGLPSWQSAGTATSIAVGTTTISSGTSNGLLYDNAGVLGNSAAGTLGQFLGANGSGVPTFASGGWTLLNTLTASSSATLDDTSSLTSSYNEYEIVFTNLIAGTGGVSAELLVHSGGSFQSTSYSTVGFSVVSGPSAIFFSPTTFIPLSYTSSVVTGAPGLSGSIRVSKPSTSAIHHFYGQLSYPVTGPIEGTLITAGYWSNSAAIDGFRFLFSSGTITSGTIEIYGRL